MNPSSAYTIKLIKRAARSGRRGGVSTASVYGIFQSATGEQVGSITQGKVFLDLPDTRYPQHPQLLVLHCATSPSACRRAHAVLNSRAGWLLFERIQINSDASFADLRQLAESLIALSDETRPLEVGTDNQVPTLTETLEKQFAPGTAVRFRAKTEAAWRGGRVRQFSRESKTVMITDDRDRRVRVVSYRNVKLAE